MPPLLALYARTFLIGIAVAAPVGAMGVLCIQRTLARGWRAGMATGAGIATADATYAGVAAFGVAALATTLVAFQTPLRVVGGLLLLWLGAQAIFAAPTHEAAAEKAAARGFGGLYLSAVGLTLTNPMTVMAFAAIFAGVGLGTQPSAASAVVATAGVASGSLAWWSVLVTGVAFARHAVSDRTLTRINVASGALVALFGAFAIGSVFFS